MKNGLAQHQDRSERLARAGPLVDDDVLPLGEVGHRCLVRPGLHRHAGVRGGPGKQDTGFACLPALTPPVKHETMFQD